MFKITFSRDDLADLKMGHEWSKYSIKKIDGISGQGFDFATSQGISQMGKTVDSISVGSGTIDLIVDVNNFTNADLSRVREMFAPFKLVRVKIYDMWIDGYATSVPLFSYALKTATIAISMITPYPFWQNKNATIFYLGSTIGGFNFPVSYSTTHNFALYSDVLFANCYNNSDIDVNYALTATMRSGTASGFIVTNAETGEYLKILTPMTSDTTISVYWENNILRVYKNDSGIVSNIFSALDEGSALFKLEPGDNVLRADPASTEDTGDLAISIRFYNTKSGVVYDD